MAKTAPVFPPDAGSTNSGATPTRAVGTSNPNGSGNCGRGIRRYGDIRHIGDLTPVSQTGTWTPGTIGINVASPVYDNDNAPPWSYNRGADIQAAPLANASPGTFGGYDASNEGFDAFSGKQGGNS